MTNFHSRNFVEFGTSKGLWDHSQDSSHRCSWGTMHYFRSIVPRLRAVLLLRDTQTSIYVVDEFLFSFVLCMILYDNEYKSKENKN